MQRLTIKQYLDRTDAYPVSPATVRRYIDAGILPGEKITIGKKTTYYVHIDAEPHEQLIERMAAG